jgi:hypothetical protein
MRALGLRPPAPAVAAARVGAPALQEDVREEIAWRLMEGEAATAIVAELVRRGAGPLAAVRQEVESTAAHPAMRAAARMAARVKKRDWLLECRARMDALPETGAGWRPRPSWRSITARWCQWC